MLEQPLVFSDCSRIQFLIHTLSPILSVKPPLVTYHSLCSTHAMPHYWSSGTSHQNLPREAEDFSRSGKYLKHLLLPKYLAYLQPEGIISTSHWF